MGIPREDGGSLTEVWYGNGTHIAISETADGVRTGSCTTPDGRHAKLPDSFFNDPVPTLANSALSGLEVQAGKGIPKLSADVLDGLKAGGKCGGPAVGIASMVYNMVSAKTLHDRCVAAWSGGVGLVGGLATSVAVGAIPGVGPIAAMGVNAGSGFLFGYVGELVATWCVHRGTLRRCCIFVGGTQCFWDTCHRVGFRVYRAWRVSVGRRGTRVRRFLLRNDRDAGNRRTAQSGAAYDV